MNRALSKAEASARLGVCDRTLDKFIADGTIKAHRVGHRWKIFEHDLDAFLAGCSNARGERIHEPVAEALAGA